MQQDIIKGRDDGLGGRYKMKGIVQEGTLYKGRMMQKEDDVKGRDDAGGHYKRERRCTRRTF